MFGLSKKKTSAKKVKQVAKKEVKIEKRQNAFDDWVKKHKKLILIENKSSIKKIYWFKEFDEFIKNGGDIEEFLKIKNERLFLEFKEDLSESMTDRNERLCDEIRKCENVKVCADKLDQLLYEFDRDVKFFHQNFNISIKFI